MFGFFKQKKNVELENIFEIVKHADIVHIRYDSSTIVYTFSNWFIILFEEKRSEKIIRVFDKSNTDKQVPYLDTNNPIFYLKVKENEYVNFKNKFTDKANQYRINLAINNENINIAEINYSINSNLFYFELAKNILRQNYDLHDKIAGSIVANNPIDNNGNKFLDLLFNAVWERMRYCYGDIGIHNKLKQLQESELNKK